MRTNSVTSVVIHLSVGPRADGSEVDVSLGHFPHRLVQLDAVKAGLHGGGDAAPGLGIFARAVGPLLLLLLLRLCVGCSLNTTRRAEPSQLTGNTPAAMREHTGGHVDSPASQNSTRPLELDIACTHPIDIIAVFLVYLRSHSV